MSRFAILFSILLLAVLPAASQRYLPGSGGVTLAYRQSVSRHVYPFVKGEYGVSMDIRKYLHRAHYMQYGFSYIHESYEYGNRLLPVQVFLARIGANRRVFDMSHTLLGYVGVQAHAGYEWVNKDEHTLFDGAELKDRSRFIYGPALSLSTDGFVTDFCALTASLHAPLFFNSDLDVFRPGFSLGVKINF